VQKLLLLLLLLLMLMLILVLVPVVVGGVRCATLQPAAPPPDVSGGGL